MKHVNNTSKPIVFVGTNSCLNHTAETCIKIGYTVAGIIDDDYHGVGSFQNLPIIAKEQDLIDNASALGQYQFFCATNWQPVESQYPQHNRNAQKRQRLIDTLDASGLDIATIVHPHADIATFNVTLGKGVIIANGCCIMPNCSVDDWSSLWQWSGLGEDNKIGRNVVIQRHAFTCGSITIEDDCYIGMCARVMKDNSVIRSGTFIHPNLAVMRSTQPNEVVSLVGKNLRRIYHDPQENG